MGNEEIINKNKEYLLFSGEISDFQAENLKKWPLIAFQNAEEVKIDYDFVDKSNNMGIGAGKVIFDFSFKKGTKVSKKDKENGFMFLNYSVKFLFWKETEVIFKRDGKVWK